MDVAVALPVAAGNANDDSLRVWGLVLYAGVEARHAGDCGDREPLQVKPAATATIITATITHRRYVLEAAYPSHTQTLYNLSISTLSLLAPTLALTDCRKTAVQWAVAT